MFCVLVHLFILYSACSQFVPALFLHVYFILNWSQSCMFILFSGFTLIDRSLSLIMIVLQQHHCPASASLLVAL